MTPNTDSASQHDDLGDSELNVRRAAILEAVVSQYIGTAEPVGSSHVADAPGVRVSSATPRSGPTAVRPRASPSKPVSR